MDGSPLRNEATAAKMSSAENDPTDGTRTSSSRNDPPPPNVCFLKLAPTMEAENGHNEASRIAFRIVASIPNDLSEVVQTAYAIEAIEEKEDYASWPSGWLITRLRTGLLKDITLLCAEKHLTGLQRARYQELCEFPHLLKHITHGFTCKLPVGDEQSDEKSNKQGFIDELMKAGRRESIIGDEASAIDEANVVHVALSYKHAHKAHAHAHKPPAKAGGTIDYETAKEAYEIICDQLDTSGSVRIWIDQNLHRYDEKLHGYDRSLHRNDKESRWYEKGYLPYAAMVVVSPLGNYGGFAIGCTRPWIWAETGLALSALGIHCKPAIGSTIEELFVFPQNAREKPEKPLRRKGP